MADSVSQALIEYVSFAVLGPFIFVYVLFLDLMNFIRSIYITDPPTKNLKVFNELTPDILNKLKEELLSSIEEG